MVKPERTRKVHESSYLSMQKFTIVGVTIDIMEGPAMTTPTAVVRYLSKNLDTNNPERVIGMLAEIPDKKTPFRLAATTRRLSNVSQRDFSRISRHSPNSPKVRLSCKMLVVKLERITAQELKHAAKMRSFLIGKRSPNVLATGPAKKDSENSAHVSGPRP